jgi:hypothetical protein
MNTYTPYKWNIYTLYASIYMHIKGKVLDEGSETASITSGSSSRHSGRSSERDTPHRSGSGRASRNARATKLPYENGRPCLETEVREGGGVVVVTGLCLDLKI